MQDIVVRPERSGDIEAIAVVDRSAFGGNAEADAVMALRRSKSFIPELSLVAEVGRRVTGHLLLFKMSLEPGSGRLRDLLTLAPMAVVPSQSHRGIGSALLNAALTRAQQQGYAAVTVVGPADYYARFGFAQAENWGLYSAPPVPAERVMARELLPGALEGGGVLRYPPEFTRLFLASA